MEAQKKLEEEKRKQNKIVPVGSNLNKSRMSQATATSKNGSDDIVIPIQVGENADSIQVFNVEVDPNKNDLISTDRLDLQTKDVLFKSKDAKPTRLKNFKDLPQLIGANSLAGEDKAKNK